MRGFGQEHSRPVTELPVVITQNQVYINGQFVDAITAERIDWIWLLGLETPAERFQITADATSAFHTPVAALSRT